MSNSRGSVVGPVIPLMAFHGAGPTRLLGAAESMRQRTGQVRFPMYQAGYDAVFATTREALGQNGFDVAWAEGAAVSTEDAIAYAWSRRT